MLVSLAGLPGVARALALEENAGLPLLVLDDAGPMALGEWLERRPMELAAFLPLALRMAETVAALHARGVVHRDVNPSNIVLDAGGEHPTLVDFGAAATLAGVSPARADLSGTLAGTLPYMAPEQTGRMGRVVDHRADLYALGATYYQMLTGAPPFTSTDPVELVHAHLARPPVPAVVGRSPGAGGAVGPGAEAAGEDAGGAVPERRGAGGRPEARAGGLAIGGAAGGASSWDGAISALRWPSACTGGSTSWASCARRSSGRRPGTAGWCWSTGPAGIGKSALVMGFGGGLPSRRGRWPGASSSSSRATSPIRPWSRRSAGWRGAGWTGPASERETWRAALLEALGRNAAVMTELIPELGSLLGELPVARAAGSGRGRAAVSADVRGLRAGAGGTPAPAVPVRRRPAVGRSRLPEAAGPAGHRPRHPAPAADRRLSQRGVSVRDIRCPWALDEVRAAGRHGGRPLPAGAAGRRGGDRRSAWTRCAASPPRSRRWGGWCAG